MMDIMKTAHVKDMPAAPAGGREARGANRRFRAFGLFFVLALVLSMALGVGSAFAGDNPVGGGGAAWGGGSGVVDQFSGHKVITIWADDRDRAADGDAPQNYGMKSADWFYTKLKWIMGSELYPYAGTNIINTYWDFMDTCRRALDESHNEALADPAWTREMGGTQKNDDGTYKYEAYADLHTRVIGVGVYIQHWPSGGDYYQGGQSTWIQNQSLIRSWPARTKYERKNGDSEYSFTHSHGMPTVDQPWDYEVPPGMDLSYGMEPMDWIVFDYGMTGYGDEDYCTRTGFENETWKQYVWDRKWASIKYQGQNRACFAVITISNDAPYGYVTLAKNSTGNLIWVRGNRMYSLAGAEYKVYTTKDDAIHDRNPVSFKDEQNHEQTVMVTKSDGSSNLAKIKQGDYWVKEVKPAPGHYVDPEPHPVKVTAKNTEDNPAKVKSNDDPACYLQECKVMKYEDGTQKPLDGAQYTVKYYDQVVTNAAQAKQLWAGNTQKATWVIETGQCREVVTNGPFPGDYRDEEFAGFACLDDPWLVEEKSNPLYKNQYGETTMPLGTVIFQETKAPDGYQLTNGDGRPVDAQHPADLYVHTLTLTRNEAMAGPENGEVTRTKICPDYYVNNKLPDGTSARIPASILKSTEMILDIDPPKRANVELFKVDEDRFDLMYYPIPGYEYGGAVPMNEAQGDVPSLEGAVFRIVNTSGDKIHSPVTYEDVAKNADIITIKTDANGYATTLPDKADVNSFASAHDFTSYADLIDDAKGWMKSGSSATPFYPSASSHPGYALTKRSTINGWTMHWKAAMYGGALSPGTYRVYEVSPPDGYMMNPNWSGIVTIPDDIKGDGTDMFVIETRTS